MKSRSPPPLINSKLSPAAASLQTFKWECGCTAQPVSLNNQRSSSVDFMVRLRSTHQNPIEWYLILCIQTLASLPLSVAASASLLSSQEVVWSSWSALMKVCAWKDILAYPHGSLQEDKRRVLLCSWEQCASHVSSGFFMLCFFSSWRRKKSQNDSLILIDQLRFVCFLCWSLQTRLVWV